MSKINKQRCPKGAGGESTTRTWSIRVTLWLTHLLERNFRSVADDVLAVSNQSSSSSATMLSSAVDSCVASTCSLDEQFLSFEGNSRHVLFRTPFSHC